MYVKKTQERGKIYPIMAPSNHKKRLDLASNAGSEQTKTFMFCKLNNTHDITLH